jgi:hypothetical protein
MSCTHFVIENIQKSGIPLELRARKVLKDNGFNVINFRYQDSDNPDEDLGLQQRIWRELDILATRREKSTVKVHGCEISFGTNILAECKYSSDKDILIFEHPKFQSADLSHFPIMISGQTMIDILLKEGIALPVSVERLVEVDHTSEKKKEDNYRDIGVHKACEQILSATRFYVNLKRGTLRLYYISMSKDSTIGKEWQTLLKGGKIPYEGSGSKRNIPQSFINEFLNDKFKPEEMLEDFSQVFIHVCFSLIITDSSRGIIQAKLNESYEVIDLDDKGICIYTYVSENVDRYESILENYFVFPVIVCNLPNLPSAISLIEQIMNCITKQIERLITINPYLIPKEILFNDKIVGI